MARWLALLLWSFTLTAAAGAQLDAPPREPLATSAPSLVPTPRPALVVGQIDTARFHLLYTERSKTSALLLGKRIEDARDDFRRVLGREWPGEMEIRIGMGREEMEALALPGAPPPAWAEALAYPEHGILLLNAQSLAQPQGEAVLRHELAHVALGRIARDWPHWFQEGMAMHLSGELPLVSRYTALFRAVQQDRVIPFEVLNNGWPEVASDVEIAYAQSDAFVTFLLDRHGPGAMNRLLDEMAAGADFDTAFARAMGAALPTEERVFRDQLPFRYGWLPLSVTNSLIWIGTAGLCVIGFLRVRRVKRRRLDEMSAEEAAEDAAARILAAEEAELGQGSSDAEVGDTGELEAPELVEPPPPSKPTVH